MHLFSLFGSLGLVWCDFGALGLVMLVHKD
jgi:hypothetical protein